MTADPDRPGDEQDQAETFDETNITADGEDIATSDLQRDVYDVTAVAADSAADDRQAEAEWSEALDAPAFPERGDFDPDEARQEGHSLLAERNDAIGEPRSFNVDNAARVSGEDLQPSDLEPGGDENVDLEALGYDEDGRAVGAESSLDERLDEGLKDTFPASDPVAITPRSD